MIWDSKATDIRLDLGSDFDAVLRKGNEILCYVEIDYKIAFGLSILILDLNLEFAVWQIEKRRQETIDRLKKEALLNLNKEFFVPVVVKNIVLVASKNTSGCQDFVKKIKG